MRSVCVANQKGGVGKTTITVTLAAAAAAAGTNVLVIDADPQGHATVALGREELYYAQGPNLATVLMGESPDVGLAELIDLHVWAPVKERLTGRIDLLPSCPAMFLVEPRMTATKGREFRLARLLGASGFEDHYDLCLIDCPPSLGILTDNALIASREVIIVAGADPASTHGLGLLISQIRSLRDALDVDVAITGLIVNKVEATRISRKSLGGFADLGLPILAEVPKRTRLVEAWDAGRPIQEFQPAGDVAMIFAQMADDLELTVDAPEGAQA